MGIHYTYGANKNAKLMEKKAKREKKLAEKRAKKQVKTGPVKTEEDKTIPLDQRSGEPTTDMKVAIDDQPERRGYTYHLVE